MFFIEKKNKGKKKYRKGLTQCLAPSIMPDPTFGLVLFTFLLRGQTFILKKKN